MKKQTVYLSENNGGNYAVCHFNYGEWAFVQEVKSVEGYFFTPEQLNEYTKSVIKQALETAAENASIYRSGTDERFDGVDQESITNVFEEVFKKFEI